MFRASDGCTVGREGKAAERGKIVTERGVLYCPYLVWCYCIIRSPKESKGSGMQSRSTANVRHYRCSCSLLGEFLCYFRFLLESRQSCAAMGKTDRFFSPAKELVKMMVKMIMKHNSYKQSSELMVQAAVFLAFFTCRLSAKRDLPGEQHQHATLVT